MQRFLIRLRALTYRSPSSFLCNRAIKLESRSDDSFKKLSMWLVIGLPIASNFYDLKFQGKEHLPLGSEKREGYHPINPLPIHGRTIEASKFRLTVHGSYLSFGPIDRSERCIFTFSYTRNVTHVLGRTLIILGPRPL
jgi:hypothetical protein